MPKSNTLNRLIPLLTIVALVAVIGVTALAALHAQSLVTYKMSINFTDARVIPVNNSITIPLEDAATGGKYVTLYRELNHADIYSYYLNKIPPYYFTRNREFEIIIANASTLYYITSTNKYEKYPTPVNVSAIALTNKTGGATFEIKVPEKYLNLIAYWKIIVLVKAWDRWWIASNFTTAYPMPLIMLLRNLTKIGTGKVGLPVINSTTYLELLKKLDTNDIIANVIITHGTSKVTLFSASGAKYTIVVYTPSPTVTQKPNNPAVMIPPGTQFVEVISTSTGKVVYKYYYFIYGAEYFKKWKEYALWLPYIQSFILYVRALSRTECDYFKLSIIMTLPSGEKITIYEHKYNSTLTIGDYCAFGPIYYMTPLYKGLEVEKIPKVPAGYEPYKPLVVKTQSPFGSLYFTVDIYYKTRVAGEYVNTMKIVTVPRGLANFGVIGLPNYTTYSNFTIIGTGLYGYIWVSKEVSPSRYALSPYVLVEIPRTEYELNVSELCTLLGKPIPRELENSLSFRWYEVTETGKRIFISTGPVSKATLVGMRYFNIQLNETYGPKYVYRGPSFTLARYYVEVYYRYDPILIMDITQLVNSTLFKKPSVSFPVESVKTSIVPVVIRIRRYVPGLNVTQAPGLTVSPEIYHNMKVVVYRSTFPEQEGVQYLTGYVTYSCELNDAVVVRQTYIAGPVEYTPVLYFVTRMPITYNITATKTPVLISPRTNDTYYYYHVYVYYGPVKVGVGVFAVGSYTKMVHSKPKHVEPWVWPVGGYEVLNLYKANQIVNFADKWNKTNKFYTVGVPSYNGLPRTVQVEGVECYNLYEAAAFITIMTYFTTLYGVPLSRALAAGVSATVQVVKYVKGKPVVVAKVPARYVEQLLIPVQVEMVNGWPLVKKTMATYTFILDYAGYKLQAVNSTTGKPVKLTVTELVHGLVWKSISFPIVYEWVKVESKSGVALPGFVVEAYSVKTGEELWRAITNEQGEAYIGALPAGKPVKLVIRTIIPSKDSKWFSEHLNVNKTLSQYHNNYAEYASVVLGYKPSEYVYTLGTRGALDAGLVANVTTIVTPATYGKEIAMKILNIRPVKVYVVYRNGTRYVLLNTLPAYPCALPLKCPAILYNVTMIVNSGVFLSGSMKNKVKLADFRIIGFNWMKSIYEKLANYYYSYAENAWTKYQETGEIKYVRFYIANMSYYMVAKLISEASSNTPYAMFYISPVFGIGNVWRVILPGQRFDIQIYYLGYKVFDNYVTIPPYNETYLVLANGTSKTLATPVTLYTMTGKAVTVEPGNIILVANVKPVTFRVLTRDTLKPIKKSVYVGLLLTDSLIRTYVAKSPFLENYTASHPSAVLAANALPIMEPFNTTLPLLVMKKISAITEVVPKYKVGEVYNMTVYMPTLLDELLVNNTPLVSSVKIKPASTVSVNFTKKEMLAGIPVYYGYIAFKIPINGVPKLITLENFTELGWKLPVGEPLGVPYSTLVAPGFEYGYIASGKVYVGVAKLKYEKVKIEIPNVPRYYPAGLLVEFNASKVYLIKNATVAMTATYYYKSKKYEVVLVPPTNVTKYIEEVMETPRLVTVLIPVNHKTLLKIPLDVRELNLKITINVTFEGTLYFTTAVWHGCALKLLNKTVTVLYTPSKAEKLNITVVQPEGPWEHIFGSPLLIIANTSTGVVTVPLPEWSVTTSAYGARIARIYVFMPEAWYNYPPSLSGYPIESVYYYNVATTTVKGVPYEIVKPEYYVIINLANLSSSLKGVVEFDYGLLGKVSFQKYAAQVLGALTGATSTLAYNFTTHPVMLYNVMKMPSKVSLLSSVISSLDIVNPNKFPVEVVSTKGKIVIEPNWSSKRGTLDINYMIAPSFAVNADRAPCLLVIPDKTFSKYYPTPNILFRYWPPNYTFYEVTPRGVVPVKVSSRELAKHEVDMASPLDTAIYYVYNDSYPYLGLPVSEAVISYHGTKLFKIPVESYKGGFAESGVTLTWMEVLGLREVMGWNGKPVVNATVVVFRSKSSDLCHPLAITFVNSTGRILSWLPYIGPGEKVMVFWYDSYIRYLFTVCSPHNSSSAGFASFAGPSKPAVPIVIYDNSINEDRVKLGEPVLRNSSVVYTWVYSLVVQVLNKNGLPLKHAVVVVKDAATGGQYFYASAILNSTGGAVIKDIRTSYSGAVSSVPASNLLVDVFIPIGKYLIPVLLNYPINLQRGSTSPVFVTTVKVSTAYVTVPITVQLQVPGMKAMPLAGATVEVTEYVPAVSYAKYGPYIIPEMSTLSTVKAGTWTLVTGSSGTVTVGPLNVAATGATTLDIKVVKVNSLPLGYEEKVELTPSSITPPVITIPGAEVKVLAVSASGSPLSIATVNVTCRYAGKIIYTGYGKGSLTFVLPLPKNVATSPIVCTAAAVAPGHVKSKIYELTIRTPSTYELKVRVPVTGWYIPGIGYVGWPQIALWIVIIFIVIIIIVIGLIEYQHWRRKRLVSILERPPSGGR